MANLIVARSLRGGRSLPDVMPAKHIYSATLAAPRTAQKTATTTATVTAVTVDALLYNTDPGALAHRGLLFYSSYS